MALELGGFRAILARMALCTGYDPVVSTLTGWCVNQLTPTEHETATGFEPVIRAFAEPRLTTWLSGLKVCQPDACDRCRALSRLDIPGGAGGFEAIISTLQE